MLQKIAYPCLALLVLAVASCASDPKATTNPPAGITVDEACAAFAKAVCAKANACAPFAITLEYGDLAGCEARAGINCPAGVNAPSSTRTADDVKECADAFAGITCDDLFGRNVPVACRDQTGSLADGAACGADQQCQSGHCNNSADVCGVCAKPIAVGGACTNDQECDWGLVCAVSKCTAPVGVGETCSPSAPCKPTLMCANGTCITPKGAGETCDLAIQDCDYLKGLGCTFANKCEPLKVAATGEPCGAVGMDNVVCAARGTCQTSGNPSGTCIAAAADGAACDAMMGPQCLSDARCSKNVCVLADPASCK